MKDSGQKGQAVFTLAQKSCRINLERFRGAVLGKGGVGECEALGSRAECRRRGGSQARVTDVALGEQGWPDQVRDESGHVWNPHRRAKSQS